MSNVVIITGATSGIGAALVNHWVGADPSAKIYALGRNRVALNQLVERSPSQIVPISAELTTTLGRRRVADILVEESHIAAVVHCAAVVTPLARLAKVDPFDWQHSFMTNVDVALFLTQLLLPKLKHSRVAFITSEQSISPVPGAAAYCVSKHALSMLCQQWRAEIDPQQSLFGLISPGLVDTPMQANIRDATAEVLPAVDIIRQLHKDGRLLPPAIVAQFLYWVMNGTPEAQFNATAWDIYDESIREKWAV